MEPPFNPLRLLALSLQQLAAAGVSAEEAMRKLSNGLAPLERWQDTLCDEADFFDVFDLIDVS